MEQKDICTVYAVLGEGVREFMLTKLFREHCYQPTLSPLVAKEKPNFLIRVLPIMYQEYRYLCMKMLCLLADEQGMETLITVLDESDLLRSLERAKLSDIGLRSSSDVNPLSELYVHLGPQFFIRLCQRGLVDVATLYAWLRAQLVPDHRRFILELVESYASDPLECPVVIYEYLRTEYNIARAQGQHFWLCSQSELIVEIMHAVASRDLLLSALADFQELLRRSHSPTEADNLIYCLFLQHFVEEYYTERSFRQIRHRYYRWLTSCPAALYAVHSWLSPCNADPPSATPAEL